MCIRDRYENGTVGGVDAGGTWSMKSGKPYVDFTIKGVKYQGVFSYGYDESAARNRVMTFTAVGANNVCIWGSKTLKDPKTESGSVTADSNAITVPSSATADFDLPLGGAYGSTVSWKVTAADNAVAVQGSKAVVKRHLKDGSATLTATITKGTSLSLIHIQMCIRDSYNFIPTGVGKVKVTASISNGQKQTFECKITKATELGIHDPSVYRDPISGNYYSFGSHLVGGKSNNLVGWTADGTGYGKAWFSKDYKEEFAEAYAYTMPNGAKENAWAPDIIYNKAMKKYCMYISIVDRSKKCCIAMATSDYPDKDYKYAGMIVCSGITTGTSTDIGKTNVAKALGITDAQAKDCLLYTSRCV